MKAIPKAPRTAATPTTPSILLTLPFSLQVRIFSYLPLPTATKLRGTCRHLYTSIPRPSHAQLLEAEKTPSANPKKKSKDTYYFPYHVQPSFWSKPLRKTTTFITCRYCVCMLPDHLFADNMAVRDRAPGGVNAHKRFCIQCGLKPPATTGAKPKYPRGTRFRVNGEELVVCIGCRKVFMLESKKVRGKCYACGKIQEVDGSDWGAGEVENLRTKAWKRADFNFGANS
ncbi:unnamed protein product [Periconia digitata]|uniref:F-box domain-containing protein n=1 Tax=Periconia digitata TaxID=1303443 RepID=A0A9W4XPV5_9PLEO|nr:unnamed protein product [Periconia digitata]